MPGDIFLDESTNDIQFINGQMRLTETQQELTRQKVDIYLNTYKGEIFWSISSGIAYLENDNNPEQLLGATNKRFLDVAIKEAISSRDGIVRLISYSSVLDKPTRTMSVTFSAETLSGEIVTESDIEIGI